MLKALTSHHHWHLSWMLQDWYCEYLQWYDFFVILFLLLSESFGSFLFQMICSENSCSCSVLLTWTFLTLLRNIFTQPVFSKLGAWKLPRICSIREGYKPGTQGCWTCATYDLRKQMREQKVHCVSQRWSMSYTQMFVTETMFLLSCNQQMFHHGRPMKNLTLRICDVFYDEKNSH